MRAAALARGRVKRGVLARRLQLRGGADVTEIAKYVTYFTSAFMFLPAGRDVVSPGAEIMPDDDKLIGKMFTVKEQLKVLFNIKYGEIVFQGQTKTAWHAKITENTEDPTAGIVAWLTSFGWEVEVIDLRK